MSVKGPFSSSYSMPDGTYSRQRTWYRQTIPRVLPLAFTFLSQRITFRTTPGYAVPLEYPPVNTAQAIGYNNAYRKLLAAIGENAGLGVDLVEVNQSIDMISKRALQLTRFTRSLLRGDIIGAGKQLGLTEKRVKKTFYSRRRKSVVRIRKEVLTLQKTDVKGYSKLVADLWLEFHFGWEPLVKDIHDSITVLESITPSHNVKVRGYATSTYRRTGSSGYDQWDIKSYWTLGALVQVSNPNLRLASQLGVVNPASLLWEVVPFSFVVDWFSNVGEFLASFTDFAGLSIRNAYQTNLEVIKVRHYVNPPYYNEYVGEYVKCVRTPVSSFNKPIPVLKPFKGFSVSRGATAISLLLQTLPNHK
ncbi:MAG: maturation protein [Sanya fiers-like virus 31]|nr:MAG: maturation protein [Sanya fiers-like virus 31]